MAESMAAPCLLVEESPSIVPMMQDVFRLSAPDTFYAAASGCLGWGLPAAVGLALGERQAGTHRPVLALLGDGSFQYSLQALYTGVQQQLQIIAVVFQNEEYGILKQFAILENTPHVPGLDLPGLDCVSLAQGYGATSVLSTSLVEFAEHFKKALQQAGVTVLVIPITKRLSPLY
ncbi:thiamine pyrophosphate-dependent enzyme [Acidithiobacillus sp. M4-SHS-6]|uniref:thiamine pyrophosphate-dependent enzyme n=1 Tax=Acidithiobacillus sp. M4-SHS-6 TaxID=3383024 RepID=UPI0039BE89EE